VVLLALYSIIWSVMKNSVAVTTIIVFYQYHNKEPQPEKIHNNMTKKKQRLGDDAVHDKNK